MVAFVRNAPIGIHEGGEARRTHGVRVPTVGPAAVVVPGAGHILIRIEELFADHDGVAGPVADFAKGGGRTAAFKGLVLIPPVDPDNDAAVDIGLIGIDGPTGVVAIGAIFAAREAIERIEPAAFVAGGSPGVIHQIAVGTGIFGADAGTDKNTY